MDKLITILAALEPVALTALALAGLLLVPLLVGAIRQHLNERQQRFAYDVAKGLADTLAYVSERTPTKVDDALASIAEQVESHLRRPLKTHEKLAVSQAVAKVTKRTESNLGG